MDDWIQILPNQWYITISTHEITWVYYELKVLPREYIACSHINLNTVGSRDKVSSMQQKCHRWYYVNTLISEYLSCNRQGWLAIDGTWLRPMERKCHRQVLSIFLNHDISNISNLCKSERKFELIISNEMWQYFFIPGVR